MPATAVEISEEIAVLGSAKIPEHLGRFFKTGAGEYGEGDQFRGNRDRSVETKYLRQHYKTMPRTMLLYAIEKYAETERKAWLNGAV